MCPSPSSRRHSPSLARLPLLLLLSAVVAAPAFATRPEVRAPPAGRATVPGSRGATSDTLWIPVHPTGTSPCSPGDAVGSPDSQTIDEIWCFEGAGGDSTWPAGPTGARFDHWSRYAPPGPPESRWHVTALHGGADTGTYNAWLGCDIADPLGACGDVDGWASSGGYGNYWNFALELDLSGFDTSAGGTIEFDLRYDVECDYDYLYLEYFDSITSTWKLVRDPASSPAVFNAVSGNPDQSQGGTGRSCGGDYFHSSDQADFGGGNLPFYGNSIWLSDVQFPVPPQPGGIRLRWRGQSDGAWSDEDGRGDTDGMAAIDNVAVTLAATGTIVTDDFESGDFSNPTVTGPAPPGGASWVAGGLIGVTYDGWHLEFDPQYANKGTTCLYSDDWMWAAKPAGTPIPANGFDYFLVTPSIEVQGWTGAVIEYSQYLSIPDGRDDYLSHQVRVWHSGSWTSWQFADDSWFGYAGGYWSMNDLIDLSPILAEFPGADSLQFAWELADFSTPGDFSWGKHQAVQVLVDNVSFGRFDGDGPRLTARSLDEFRDTFSRSDPAHTAFLSNAEEGQWPGRTLADDESLSVDVDAPNGVSAGNARLFWRVGTGLPPTFGAWTSKAMNLSWPDPFGSPGSGTYRTSLGDDASEDWSGTAGDGVIWDAGTTVDYYVRVQDDAAAEATLAGEFSVLPFDATSPAQGGARILVVNDTPYRLLDFENSSGYDARAVGGWGTFRDPAFVPPVRLVTDALTLAGLAFDVYDVAGPGASVQVEPRGAPLPGAHVGGFLDASGLPYYDAIIWESATQTSIDDEDVRTDLQTYLDAGGKLLAIGADVVNSLQYLFADPEFAHEYLGAELTAPNDETIATQLAMAGAPGELFDGDRYSLFGGCPALVRMDRLTPTSPAQGVASAALIYTDGDVSDEGRVAAVRAARPGGGQAVTCGFDVSSLPSRVAIRCFLQTVLEEGFGLQMPSPGACSNGVDVPGPGLPLAFDLACPEPTPFVDRTRISFTLREHGSVSLTVHDLLGRRVATLASGPLERGPHSLTWDGRSDQGTRAASGVYFVRLVAGEEHAARKLVRLR